MFLVNVKEDIFISVGICLKLLQVIDLTAIPLLKA